MVFSFIKKILVFDIPQLLWAIITHGVQSVALPLPSPSTIETGGTAPETADAPVTPTLEVPGTTGPEAEGTGSGSPSTDTSDIPPVDGIPIEKPVARLFAVVIGINEYKFPEIKNLRGAVPDAEAVAEYLEGTLKVPSTQIKKLYDKDATRANIVKAISDLAVDGSFVKEKGGPILIEKGDPILIYYAGHGASAPAPPSWEAGGPEVQLLVPYDHKAIDAKGRTVTDGIPDRTLGVLLTRLAKAKGNNITVIFDCCHSGSGTRDDDDDLITRGLDEGVLSIHEDLDRGIWEEAVKTMDEGSRGSAFAPGFAHKGIGSHVLLAGCGAREKSREKDSRGLFTDAFLKTITDVGAENLTYEDLIQRLPSLPMQNPQCEGVYQDRIFFNAKASAPRLTLYKIRQVDDEYEMDAGAAHGITTGARFAVYKDRETAARGEGQLGTVVAQTPEPFFTVLDLLTDTTRFTLTGDGYALLVRAGTEEDLRLHVAMKQELLPVFEALAKEMQVRQRSRNILLVEKEKAELDIDLEDGKVVFNILNPVVVRFGLTRMPYTVKPNLEDLIYPIRAAAHFYWHLRRKDPKGTFYSAIDVEFHELKVSKEEFNILDGTTVYTYNPTGLNLNVDNVIDLKIKNVEKVTNSRRKKTPTSTKYGIKIVNKSILDLYVSVFYFDNSSLEIVPYFSEVATAKDGEDGVNKLDPHLLAKQSLTIGYGATATPPPTYFLRDGQDLDVGFIKLFLSTEYVNLKDIPQKSPFSEDRGTDIPKEKAPAIWGTILIPVVQRRA